jgi:hypothetical protein
MGMLQKHSSHQQQDDDNHQHDAETAAGEIAPALRVAPGRQGADEGQDQDDDEDRTEHWGIP